MMYVDASGKLQVITMVINGNTTMLINNNSL